MVVQNFRVRGLLNPALAYLTSSLGCFLACSARPGPAMGAQRAVAAAGAVSIGITGIWVMHFIAMLGFSIPGQTITYSAGHHL